MVIFRLLQIMCLAMVVSGCAGTVEAPLMFYQSEGARRLPAEEVALIGLVEDANCSPRGVKLAPTTVHTNWSRALEITPGRHTIGIYWRKYLPTQSLSAIGGNYTIISWNEVLRDFEIQVMAGRIYGICFSVNDKNIVTISKNELGMYDKKQRERHLTLIDFDLPITYRDFGSK